MVEKFLVFGAQGRVGSAIIKALPSDVNIRAADISDQGEFSNNVELVIFDFNKPTGNLSYLFEDVRGIFLLWPPGVSAKRAIEPVIRAAAEHGVKQVVFLSILGADKLKVVPHRSVEKLIESSGMDYVFLRSAYFMQNLSGIHAPEIREQDEIFIPAGSGTLGFVDVRDVGAVGAKALLEGHKDQTYNLTGGEARTFEQAAAIFSDVLGKEIRYSNPSILRFFRHMRARGIPTGLISFMVLEYSATKMGKSGLISEDLKKLLGRPATSFRQFVQDHIETWHT